MAGNLALIRELAGAGTPVHPVVKADAYGHGAIPVARALEAAGADGFCVATLDEGLALREAGVVRPILVLYPIPPQLSVEARDAGIAVTAGDPSLLGALLGALDAAPAGPRIDLHLELETGLGRGGFDGGGLVDAARTIASSGVARLAGLWTHLQAPEDQATTDRQVEAFTSLARDVERFVGIGDAFQHVTATGGLLLGEVAALGGVRPGLATYGLVPDELLGEGSTAGPAPRSLRSEVGRLRPVLSLRARPVRVATLPTGSGISYGPTFRTARPSCIATLPLGYGDGWSRALSNRAEALVRGMRVPLVGNVAMDAVMADVTEVPGEPVTVDDEFVLIGTQGSEAITAAEVAAARGTNSWEVVTNLAARLPRVYHAASVPRETRTLVGDEVTAGGRHDGERTRRPR